MELKGFGLDGGCRVVRDVLGVNSEQTRLLPPQISTPRRKAWVRTEDLKGDAGAKEEMESMEEGDMQRKVGRCLHHGSPKRLQVVTG